jgi:signal transduction histidine kinase/ligand-binding sensor domain-containing protein
MLNIVFASIIITSNITGQNSNLVFSHFNKTQGISDIFINGIVQDRQRFLWIATWDGLNRYDGCSFKVYKTIEGDSTSISSNGVRSLTVDNKGRMWILCINGINVYDSKKDKFIRFYINNEKSATFIMNILPDSKGTLWVGTQSEGLWKVPVNTLTAKPHFKEYWHENDNPNSLSRNNVVSIFEDKQSNIWISNGTTLVGRYNPVNDNFEHFEINAPGLDNTTNYSITFQLEDNEGLLWLGSYGSGIISWDRKDNTFKQYKHQPDRNSLSSDIVRHIRQDKKGILWISTDGGGLSFYDKKSGLFEYSKNDPFNPNSLSGDGIVASLEDSSGVVWIGASRMGLNKYEANKTKFGLHVQNPFDKNSLSTGTVESFVEDKDGNIWIGTDGGGLNLFEQKTNTYKHFQNDPSNPNSLSSNAIVCMTADNEDNIWIGTYAGGLNCYDRKKNKFISYKHNTTDKNSISHNNIFVVLADSKNSIWAGTMEGTLNLFDRKTGRFYQYKKVPGDPDSFNENYMTCIFEDSRHYLWIGTGIGLDVVKLNDYDFTKPFPNLKFYHYTREENTNSIGASNFTAINEDHEGNMWFGTDGFGMAKMDMKTNKYIYYREKDGLTSDKIKVILEDNDNNLWIGTTNGISKFDPITKIFRNFNVYDGLQDFRFSRSHLKTKDGQLYFGGGKGYNAFYPRDIIYNKIPPNVVIADFKVFNKSVIAGERIDGNIILNQTINETKELVLSYKINFFAFEFAALDFTSPEKNKYAYKMEGFDKVWNYVGTEHKATYTNLDPGEYTFMVKAANNDGVWNETPATIKIIITPPFWKTWWFRIIAFLIVLSLLIGFYMMRVSTLNKQKLYLEKLVEERTHEIREKNRMLSKQTYELNESNVLLEEQQQQIEEQNQMLTTQAENLSETNTLLEERHQIIEEQAEELSTSNDKLTILNATKDKFFSIIAHDLKNPFNSIMGFSEILSMRYEKIDDTKRKNMIGAIYESSKNLFKLLENLLHWARSQTGNIKYEPEEFILNELIDANISLLENLILEKNLEIKQNLESKVKIFADINMINTVIRNLITNAIKYTETGSIGIEVFQDNVETKVSIIDTGIGISNDKVDKIFDVMSSKSTHGTRGESGTGLGLIICKEFIEKNGGSISVLSEPGKGSTFYFTIPNKPD